MFPKHQISCIINWSNGN